MAKKKKETATEPIGKDDWELDNDLRSLATAHAIKKDPERMKRVKGHARKKLAENKRRKAEADHMVELGQGREE
jgi:hypothetical protein